MPARARVRLLRRTMNTHWFPKLPKRSPNPSTSRVSGVTSRLGFRVGIAMGVLNLTLAGFSVVACSTGDDSEDDDDTTDAASPPPAYDASTQWGSPDSSS